MNGISAINEEENYVLVSVNPQIYSLDTIYTAAYVFLEKAYLVLDGNLQKEISIKLTGKKKCGKEELTILGEEFLNELINYGFYKKQSEQNKQIRQILLRKALLTGLDEEIEQGEFLKEFEDLQYEEEDLEEIEDPEGIAIPWEEKYGDRRKKDSASGE
jgi:His-Xaa-Ser system protein HxsD